MLKKEFYIDNIGDIDIPPPPEYGSTRFSHDEKEYSLTHSMRDSSRWLMAIDDASYRQFDKRVSEELGIQITKNKTPSIYRLLRIIQKSSLRLLINIKKLTNALVLMFIMLVKIAYLIEVTKIRHGLILQGTQHFHGQHL